ncbi:hypothetical protein J0689_28005, partial [Vibrio parahaemolyticus]|uniref:PDZ domain-containing protein n=1 Tax=Vibrio parahaemolyticus TaxID=670 RepID=UPI001A8E7173
MLILAAVLVAAGALNFAQRVTHELPPTDGGEGADGKDGIIARSVVPGSVGARAGILPGDKLLAVAFVDLHFEQ